MSIQLLMPALSPTMTEGTVGQWLKKEGDRIEPGEVIAEIETDKATMEFEAIDSGILAKILVPSNTQGVKVNSIIAIIAEEDEDIQECIAAYNNSATKIELDIESKIDNVQVLSQISNARIFASPLARNIATQQNIDLLQIVGTGPYGRIIKDDLTALNVHKSAPQSAQIISNQDNIQIIELSNMRKVIAQRLLESKTTIPHFYLTVDCNVTKLVQLREEINNNFKNIEQAVKISVNDMIVKATGLAINALPTVNSTWGQTHIIQHDNIDISIAVALDEGLITPIVRNVNHKSLTTISEMIKDLAKRAKANKLKPEEYQGGSISISNLGMYSVDSFLAIINPPQSCILSVGSINKKPIVIDNQIEIASILTLNISCDHRVIDGALAAQFINKIKLYLENPLTLI